MHPDVCPTMCFIAVDTEAWTAKPGESQPLPSPVGGRLTCKQAGIALHSRVIEVEGDLKMPW